MRMMPTIPAGLIVASLQRSAALDQLDDQHHNSNHEEEVNEAAERVGADQSKKPEHKQDHKYCPEHKVSFRLSLTLLRARRFRCAYRQKNFCSLWDGSPACAATLRRGKQSRGYNLSTTDRKFQAFASSRLRA